MSGADDKRLRDRAYLEGWTAKNLGQSLERNKYRGNDRMARVCAEAWADGWTDRQSQRKGDAD